MTIGGSEATKEGSSLMNRTAIVAVAVAVLNAVLPPLTVVSAVPPDSPYTERSLLKSQARKVNVAVPFQLVLGRKRIVSWLATPSELASSKRALLAETVLPKMVQGLWLP